ncbi:MAG TPA: D-2-hydroxyacid dehydrogenase [Terrimicrobiaceae bacterium]|nr:D-2-hydroxyacid dehydrogenase [Terrimicrobiaceae bacterium]
MNKPLCLTTSELFTAPTDGGIPAVEGLDIRILRDIPPGQPWPDQDASRVEVIFATHLPANLDAFASVRWIQIESSGYSHLFPFALHQRKGLTVTNARGMFDCPIAEWNMAMMINLVRDVRTMIRNQDARIWDRSAQFTGELRGRTLGIWGYGGIGRQTARLAKAFGMRVHVLARSGKKSRDDSTCQPGTGDPDGTLPDEYFSEDRKLAFLEGLDFLILALPLTAKTEGMLGHDELHALPRGAFLLNPARGPIVQEDALLAALRDGHLGGAALDTHYHYPMPPDHPLWAFPNVILTPHIAGTTFSPNFKTDLLAIFRTNAARFLAGEPLLNAIPSGDLTPSR